MNDPEMKKILEEGIHEKKDDLETCIALSGKIVIANREFPAPTAGVLAMLEQIQSPFIAEGNGKVEQLDILRALYLLSEREKALLPILRIRHLESQLEAIPEPSDAAALFVLIEQRKKLADAQAIPPYIILSDKTLHQLATLKPTSIEAFGEISGIGEYKKEKYGKDFVTLICSMLDA